MLTSGADPQASRLHALRVVLLSAVVLGLCGAAIQVSVQMARALLLDRLVFTSRDVIWMAPISWTLFTLAIALPIAAAALLLPHVRWDVIALVTFTIAAGLILLSPFGAIATWASMLVSTGIAVQLARMLPTQSPRWPIHLQRTAAGLVVAFGVASLIGVATRQLGERRAIAGLPAADAAAPNVILVVFDVVRAANLSAYGYGRPTTPVLERMGREGATFERAYSVAPWTLPSHASMFTGRFPTELAANYRRGLEAGVPTLAESFQQRGYRTAGFTGNAVYTGWDAKLSRGFERWSDYVRTARQVQYGGLPWQASKVSDLSEARSLRDAWVALRYIPLQSPTNLSFDLKRGTTVSDEFLAWQRALPRDRPFFAFLNYYDAHRPRFAPPEISARFTGGKSPAFDRYDAAVAFVDQQLGRVMDSLQAQGVLDRTIIAVVSDHGELLGEHEFVGHSNMVYRDLLWVPFLLRYPGRVPAGVRVSTAVSLRDVGATLIDVSRGQLPAEFGGTSLAPLMTDGVKVPVSPVFAYAHQGANVADRFPNKTGPLFSIVLDSLHYIRHPKEELLFNLRTDSAEANNLAADPRFAASLAKGRRLVDSIAPRRP
ncbi:MAG: sulfatase [Cytophagaceae bacterium]|nr:sulfatase [Gemmatimonadaceae bacterium]